MTAAGDTPTGSGPLNETLRAMRLDDVLDISLLGDPKELERLLDSFCPELPTKPLTPHVRRAGSGRK